MLAVLDGRGLAEPVQQAARLLATVLGQDLETGEDGVLRIARGVAKDRVISTVDPDARHGHKTSARGFDGYKGHAAVDPDSEIITATTVTPGNAGDASVAEDFIADLLGDFRLADLGAGSTTTSIPSRRDEPGQAEPKAPRARRRAGGAGGADRGARSRAAGGLRRQRLRHRGVPQPARQAGIEDRCKTQTPTAAGGLFSKDRFGIDLEQAAMPAR